MDIVRQIIYELNQTSLVEQLGNKVPQLTNMLQDLEQQIEENSQSSRMMFGSPGLPTARSINSPTPRKTLPIPMELTDELSGNGNGNDAVLQNYMSNILELHASDLTAYEETVSMCEAQVTKYREQNDALKQEIIDLKEIKVFHLQYIIIVVMLMCILVYCN